MDAAPPPAVAIIRGDHPLALFAVPTRGSAEAVALLFASDPAEAAPPDPVLLRNQFGFTRAEARVVAALAEGIDAPTIASRHVVSVETVRSQIKSAQAKSGAGSQAGLALLARRSVGGLRRNFT
jgi:DNA-binding CsgD family transcriptional regulator